MRKNLSRVSIAFLTGALLSSGSMALAGKNQGAAIQKVAPAVAPAQYQLPSDEAQLIMIRSTLIALNQANQANNYAVLAALAGPAFQAQNSPQSLSNSFQSFRANNIDIAPIVLIMPRLAQKASIVDGKLRMVGTFPSQPLQVNFDLTYEVVGGQWKLGNLAVNLQK